MHALVFFRSWSWPKVVALCGGWILIVLAFWLIEFFRSLKSAEPDTAYLYRISIHLSVGAWFLLLGPIALILLVRWRATR